MSARAAALFACLVLLGCASKTPDGKTLPRAGAFLFWKPDEQLLGYRHIARIFPTHSVKRGETVLIDVITQPR